MSRLFAAVILFVLTGAIVHPDSSHQTGDHSPEYEREHPIPTDTPFHYTDAERNDEMDAIADDIERRPFPTAVWWIQTATPSRRLRA